MKLTWHTVETIEDLQRISGLSDNDMATGRYFAFRGWSVKSPWPLVTMAMEMIILRLPESWPIAVGLDETGKIRAIARGME